MWKTRERGAKTLQPKQIKYLKLMSESLKERILERKKQCSSKDLIMSKQEEKTKRVVCEIPSI